MFERILVGRIENRILVGILSFVGIMIIVGWAAINEGGRMRAFEQLYTSRSIENGAALFATNCTRCHGADGRGRADYGPGLNNPQFFGHDFFPEITREINNLNAEKIALESLRGLSATSDARKAEIDAEIAEIDAEIEALSLPREQQIQSAVDMGYDPQRPVRTSNLGWIGTHESFVLTTLIHGRPTSINYWGNGAMPAWSQTAGGPLRMDQLQDIVNYIENFNNKEWTLADLGAVRQFAKEPVDGAPLLAQIELLQQSGGVLPEPVGTDVQAILTELEGFTGDPARGDLLYHNQEPSLLGASLPCLGCHIQNADGTGPMTDGTFTRVQNERLTDPAFAGYTARQYLVESIVLPSNYVVPGFADGMAATTFATSLSYQDLADILAYLETMNQ